MNWQALARKLNKQSRLRLPPVLRGALKVSQVIPARRVPGVELGACGAYRVHDPEHAKLSHLEQPTLELVGLGQCSAAVA